MYRRTTFRYNHRGWNLELSLNPFKLGTTTVPKTILVANKYPVQGKMRLYMLPFITLTRYKIKGEINV